jgi:hypothetical protein
MFAIIGEEAFAQLELRIGDGAGEPGEDLPFMTDSSGRFNSDSSVFSLRGR